MAVGEEGKTGEGAAEAEIGTEMGKEEEGVEVVEGVGEEVAMWSEAGMEDEEDEVEEVEVRWEEV